MAFDETKDEVMARIISEVRTTSKNAFRASLSLKLTEGDTPEEHIERMAETFAVIMQAVVPQIVENTKKWEDAPETSFG